MLESILMMGHEVRRYKHFVIPALLTASSFFDISVYLGNTSI